MGSIKPLRLFCLAATAVCIIASETTPEKPTEAKKQQITENKVAEVTKQLNGTNLSNLTIQQNPELTRRQDGGFNFMNFFLNGDAEQQQQQQQQQKQQILRQQPSQNQQLSQQQKQYLLQKQIQEIQRLQQQAEQQLELQQLLQKRLQHLPEPEQQQLMQQLDELTPDQQQQLRQLLLFQLQAQQLTQNQQIRDGSINNNINYPEINQINQQKQQLQQQQQQLQQQQLQQQQLQQQQQQLLLASNRIGPYTIGGNSYVGADNYPAPAGPLGWSLGLGTPAIGGGGTQIGNIFRILPRVMKVLTAGGKVMFGMELGKNFYLGPVGAKPLY